MNKNFVITSVVSGIVLFCLGGLFYGLLLADYFADVAGVDGLYKNPPDLRFLALGELFTGSALTLVVTVWAGAKDVMSGLKVGALFGLLFGLGFALTFYATSYIGDFTSSMVDVGISVVRMGIAGGVATFVMSKLGGSEA